MENEMEKGTKRIGKLLAGLHSYPGIELSVPLWCRGDKLKFKLGDEKFWIDRGYFQDWFFIDDTVTTVHLDTLSEGIRYMEFRILVEDFRGEKFHVAEVLIEDDGGEKKKNDEK